MGTATNRAEWKPQGIGNRVGKAAIRAGAHIEQMKTAGQQKGIERVGRLTALLPLQRIVAKKAALTAS
jgi:hypothetical protein